MLIAFSSCSTPYLIVPQEKLSDYPCQERNTGVNVRIKNNGKIAFTKFSIQIDGQEMFFSGLRKGEISCYKNIPYLWSNNSYNIFLSKQEGYLSKLMLRPADHVGESRINQGYLTLNVVISKSKNGTTAVVNIKAENR